MTRLPLALVMLLCLLIFAWNFSFYGTRDASGIGGGTNTGGQDHGTKVAGLIAAQHNNGGIAGVAPDTKLVPFPVGNNLSDWESAEATVGAIPAEEDSRGAVRRRCIGLRPGSSFPVRIDT